MLAQALDHGLELRKIYRVLEFKQKYWLRPYTKINTKMREQSKNKFEENFYKLMNNSIYGKCLQDKRKEKDVKAITKWKGRYGLEARVAQPNFHSSMILSEDLVLVQMERTTIFMNRPVYAGVSILDISKTIMYRFYYDFMKRYIQPSQCVKIKYIDTDSFIL